MNLTYAIADLHGAYDLLDLALVAIDRHAAAAPAGTRAIVFLGDYIDRGPQSRDIIERLMAGPPDEWRWVCLKGNHEDMMAGVFDGDYDLDWWVENGGGATLLSYNPDPTCVRLADILAAHIDWARMRPPLAVDRHRVFVHAGVDPTIELQDQSEQRVLWSRDSNALGHRGRFVVHGHTPHRK